MESDNLLVHNISDVSDGSFCPGPLWDANLTWNTYNPDFPACFQLTVFVYVPALILALFGPLEFYLASKSKDRGVPWSILGLLKVGLNVGLVACAATDLGFGIHYKLSGSYAVLLKKYLVGKQQSIVYNSVKMSKKQLI